MPAPAPATVTAAASRAADITARSTSGLDPFIVDLGIDGWWPLTRDEAWLTPAVAQGLQVIAGTIATLPLERRRGRTPLELGTFLTQPDPEEPATSTFTRLIEDLILFPYAYLVVIDRDADGFPRHARYVPAEYVEPVDPPLDPWNMLVPPTRYRIGPTLEVVAGDVIRFPSHWPGLLTVGARALRTGSLLEQAAQRFATVDLPAGAVKNSGADLPPDKVQELLSTWETARRSRGIAYLNALVDFTPFSWDPTQLQLVDARRWQTAEVGRLLNLPSRYLNAEAESSMTYSNVESERRDLVDLSLRPYISAVESRLSLDDIVPHGQTITFELDDFYRGDLAARSAYYTAGLAAGWLLVDEVRRAEGQPPLPGTAPAPGPSTGVNAHA